MKQIAPIKRSKDQARQYYNRISGIYDWLTSSEKSLIAEGVNALSPQPGDWILEIGCGSGSGLELISEAQQKSGTLVGLDLAHQMLLKSLNKSNAALLQADGCSLPLKTKTFDSVFCSFTLELFSEKEIPEVLSEIRRVLKPAGQLVVVALATKPDNLAVKIYKLTHRLFPVAVDCRPIPLHLMLTQNGYQVLREKQTLNWGLPVDIIKSSPA